jgi:exopolysaccharide biosynthesis polyprenyl glycosylphosphotransferase
VNILPNLDIETAPENDSWSADYSEIVEFPGDIKLHLALPLSRDLRENLDDRNEQPHQIGEAATERRSRTAPERPIVGDASSPASSRSDQGSLLPRPYLLASGTAWAVLDFAAALCSGALATLAHVGIRKPFVTWASPSAEGLYPHLLSIVGVVLFALCVVALSRIFGLQTPADSRSLPSKLRLIVLSVCIAGFALDGALLFFALPTPTGPMLKLEIIWSCAALFLSRVLWRRRWDIHFERNIAVKNLLIAGADPIGREVKEYLASQRYAGYRFKGFVKLNEDTDDYTLAEGKEIVGSVDNLISLARSMFVDEIIFSQRPSDPNLLSNVLSQARSVGIDVRLIPSFSETLKNRADVQYLGELPTIVLYHHKKRAVSNLMKRSMDILLGSIGMIAISPLCLVIAILIKLQSPGPVFYRSKRVGFKGMAFSCYKFRTMMENADSMRDQLAHLNERSDILFKIAKDPRVTGIGAVLRKYSLDELPQLWNVLSGDMSLVGPRPSISSEVAQYKTAHLRRLDVVPGMTGLWQVEGRHDPSFESYISLDSKYVKDWSLWLDMKIIFRTVNAVLKGTGA